MPVDRSRALIAQEQQFLKRVVFELRFFAEGIDLFLSRQTMVTCLALLAMAASMASHANAPDPSTITSCTQCNSNHLSCFVSTLSSGPQKIGCQPFQM